MEKEDSDSDPEVVAARQERKRLAARREAEEEARQQAAAEKAAQLKAEADAKEQVLKTVCPDDAGAKVLEFMARTECTRPVEFQERLDLAGRLRETAKAKFQDSDNEDAAMRWLGAVHCLDFTANQLLERTPAERQQVKESLVPVLSNLSVVLRKLGRRKDACAAADVGLDVAQELPYKESKPLRVKLRFHRALAKGEARDFAGAREDLRHVLQLDPEHDSAKTALRNCDLAIRLEKGPEETRWKLSLTAQLPSDRTRKQRGSLWWKVVAVVFGPLLAFYVMRLLPGLA